MDATPSEDARRCAWVKTRVLPDPAPGDDDERPVVVEHRLALRAGFRSARRARPPGPGTAGGRARRATDVVVPGEHR